MIRLLHISDSHGIHNAIADCIKLAESGIYDACIQTGDAVTDIFEDPLPQKLTSTFLSAIGNHDALLKIGAISSGYDWSKQPTSEQLYEKFLANINDDNVHLETNHTYYYKIIRDDLYLIVINSCVLSTSSEYNDQIEWLSTILQKCIDNNIKVIIAAHFIQQMQYDNLVDCNFTNRYNFINNREVIWPFHSQYVTSDYTFVHEGYQVIADAVENGLDILLWLHGHSHADGVFLDDSKDLHVVITLTGYLFAREDLARTYDAFTARFVANEYDISEDYKTITIYRLGADSASSGDARKMLVYDLVEKKVLNENSIGN